MTLPAFDTWDIRGSSGPKYKVGPTCANPGCEKLAEHAHHIVRRSQIAGDFPWIVVWGSELLPNLTGLCPGCHDLVTGRVGGHRAAIRWVDDLYYWATVVESNGKLDYFPLAPLDPHPPTLDSLAQRASLDEPGSDPCPFCGQIATTTRRRRTDGGTPRRRKSWCIKVPDDHEDGADVLDALVDDLAPLLHVEPSQTGRYFVIVPTLVYAQQNRRLFIDSIRGVGG